MTVLNSSTLKPHLPAWLRTVELILLVILALGIFTYANYRFTAQEPGGADFLHRWLPVRLLLFEGYTNPYTLEVSQQVQLFRYGGRLALPGEVPCLFAYPYYTAALFVPFALVENYPLARALFMTLMELCHIGILLLTFRLLKLSLSPLIILLLFFFALVHANMAQALIDGNVSSLAALFAMLALFFLSERKDHLAGVFLALSTIKPQLVVLFIPLVILWAFSTRRWKVIFSATLSFAALLGVSFLCFPGWLLAFVLQLSMYTEVASPSTPRAILSYWMEPSLANLFGWVLSAGSLLLMITAWVRCYGKDFSQLLWAASLTFALIPLTGITSAKSNYVAMLPGIVLLLSVLVQRWKLRPWKWSVILLLLIAGSWFSFWAGQNLYIGETRLYFIDFYPMLLWLVPGLWFQGSHMQQDVQNRRVADDAA